MLQRHRAKAVRRLAQAFKPIPFPRRCHARLAEHQIDEGIHQMRLAREVVIDAHGLAAEFVAEPACAQRRQPLAVDQDQRRRRDPFPRQRRP
jgi:hypothetical protein